MPYLYEQDLQKLAAARSMVSTDPAVQVWTAANKDALVIQAVALMEYAGVPLPRGTIADLVAIKIPATRLSGVDTEFHPWSNHEVHAALA